MKTQVEHAYRDIAFHLEFSEESSFNINFSESFTPTGVTPYTGSYEAIPKVIEQSLPTKDRWMAHDVVVQAIPYYEVENVERGTTAIIGGV